MQLRAAIILVGLALYLALAFGLRMALHRRSTGTSGWRGLSGAPGSLEWFGGVLFAASLVAGVLGAVLVLLTDARLLWDPSVATDIAGALLFGAGVVGTLWSQSSMGASWRIGVDRGEITELVMSGPFQLVRNPIYTSMIVAVVGLVMVLPSLLVLVALVLLLVGLEVQVRVVEEPHLVATQGERYLAYARRVGRFVPVAGRLR